MRLTSMAEAQELHLFGTLPSRLHRGEASCLAIAHHRGWMLLTDDRDARDEAICPGLRVSGAVGSLVLAVERNLCTLQQANAWLREMIRQGYYSPVTDLTPLLKPPGRA
jgi:predicted nucleic acid-binding protein